MPLSALLTLAHQTFHIGPRPPISESFPRFFCSIQLCQVIMSSVVQVIVRGFFLLFFVCAMRGCDLFSRTYTHLHGSEQHPSSTQSLNCRPLVLCFSLSVFDAVLY